MAFTFETEEELKEYITGVISEEKGKEKVAKHKTLTNTHLHEVKGADTADAYTVLASLGDGTTKFMTLQEVTSQGKDSGSGGSGGGLIGSWFNGNLKYNLYKYQTKDTVTLDLSQEFYSVLSMDKSIVITTEMKNKYDNVIGDNYRNVSNFYISSFSVDSSTDFYSKIYKFQAKMKIECMGLYLTGTRNDRVYYLYNIHFGNSTNTSYLRGRPTNSKFHGDGNDWCYSSVFCDFYLTNVNAGSFGQSDETYKISPYKALSSPEFYILVCGVSL